MEPGSSTELDDIPCDVCGTGSVLSHCELCVLSMCMNCVGDHLSEPSRRHTVVPYTQRSLVPKYPECPNHPNTLCELYCEKCRVVVCYVCASTGQHQGHNKVNVLQDNTPKTGKLKTSHEGVAPEGKHEKAGLEGSQEKLTRLPPNVPVHLPSVFPETIRTEDICPLFDSLSELSITTDENSRMSRTPDTVPNLPPGPQFLPPGPQFMEQELASTSTGFFNVHSSCCIGDNKLWVCGNDKILKCFKLRGHKLLCAIQTRSGSDPLDIAVMSNGDLVYTDVSTKTVNIVKKKNIKTVITLREWMPLYVCSTSTDGLLVTMSSNDKKQSRVVRYIEFMETQSIQFDDEGKPLYSCGCLKYISENRNLDICVADWQAKAVVVVNQSGKFRFRYTGHPAFLESFDPVGITTDSHGHILVSDCKNDRIHVLHQDGQFLTCIDNCNIQRPSGLCVDSKDNLFVAERARDTVKKIQYTRQ